MAGHHVLHGTAHRHAMENYIIVFLFVQLHPFLLFDYIYICVYIHQIYLFCVLKLFSMLIELFKKKLKNILNQQRDLQFMPSIIPCHLLNHLTALLVCRCVQIKQICVCELGLLLNTNLYFVQ